MDLSRLPVDAHVGAFADGFADGFAAGMHKNAMTPVEGAIGGAMALTAAGGLYAASRKKQVPTPPKPTTPPKLAGAEPSSKKEYTALDKLRALAGVLLRVKVSRRDRPRRPETSPKRNDASDK